MIRMTWVRGFAPLLLAAAIGCGGSSPPVASTAEGAATPAAPSTPTDVAIAETAGPAEDDESTADLTEHHRHHHHGGFAMFIAISLDSLGTNPEQSAAIAKIQGELYQRMAPAHDAEKAVLLTLADGIAAGNIDQAKVDAAIAQLAQSSAGLHNAVADLLNELHNVLTPPQRIALVDKLQAHFEVWHRENSSDESAERDAHGGQLAKLAKDLGLSAAQVEAVRSSFKTRMAAAHRFERAEGDAHLKAFEAAFESDSFDAKTLTTGGPVNAHMAEWGVRRMAHLYAAVSPVLTPDQRTKLAEQLRRHANYKHTAT